MDYLVVGYPHGLNGHYIEIGRVTASSKEDALQRVPKSIWYEYHAEEFKQERYDELKMKNHFEIRIKIA